MNPSRKLHAPSRPPVFPQRANIFATPMTIAPDGHHASQDIARTVQRLRGLDDDTPTKGFAPRAIASGILVSLPIYAIAGVLIGRAGFGL